METYRIITGSDERVGPHLSHYGVLGMKWGVRRTPEQLGRHTIPKGTTIYRTTVDPNESSKGSTYVSYLPPDRDHYRAWNEGPRQGKNLYEKQYKLSKDLTVPSRKELTEVINDVIKKDIDGDFLKEVAKTRVKWLSDDTWFLSSFQWTFSDETMARIEKESEGSPIKYWELVKKQAKQELEPWVDSYIDKMSKDTPEELMSDVAQYFGSATKTRQAVIDELKKRGYNAMVDEASVGGINERAREGVDPLIVFDQEETLEPTKTRRVSYAKKSRATNRYIKWRQTAQSNDRNNQW